MRRQYIGFAKPAAIAVLICSALPAMPQLFKADEKPIFAELNGISCKGASDSAFPGFAVASFTFGDSLATSTGSAGQTTGKASFQDISIVKGLDDCTPLLFEAVAKGSHLPTATITVVGKGKVPVLVIQLTNVFVTSDKFTEGAARELDEVLTLSYSKITITHVPSGNKVTIDVATGSVG